LAIGAVAADFGAGYCDFYLAIAFDLLFELLEEGAFYFPYLAAAQAGDVNVVAQAVAFVIVLIAADVEKVKLVDEAVALEHIQCAIDGDAMDVGIDFLGAFEDGSGVEVLIGIVHNLDENAALTGETDFFGRECGLQAAGTLMSVDSFATRDALSAICRHG
jgi:hypothetical protein